uniref:ABC-type amino acid transport system, periplasmic component n=1 Tax=Weissella thailandensis fsh4-2 TaxID=1056112 RepID=G0UG07_9LACO|nr:ABC-type amino acid transport system, periplasmic component [Weissella thailandensis fsh4-2]
MKKHHYTLWVISLVIIVAIVVGGALLFKKSTTKTDSNNKTIKIATAGTIFPNAYKENGKLTGYDVEIAQAAAKAEGYKVKFTTTDFDGVFGQVDAGRVDTIANDIGATPERRKKYIFSDKYNKETTNIAVKNGTQYQQIKELEGKTVATSGAGNNFIETLKEYDPQVKIKVYETRDQAVQALITDRVDGLLYSRGTLSALIKQQDLKWRVIDEDASSPQAIAYPFKDDEAGHKSRAVFNKGLKKIKSDGTLNKISDKYFGYDMTQVISKK